MKKSHNKQYVLKAVKDDYSSLYLPPHLAINYEFGVWQKCFHPSYPFHVSLIPDFNTVHPTDHIAHHIKEYNGGLKLLLCEAKDFVHISKIWMISSFSNNTEARSLLELFNSIPPYLKEDTLLTGVRKIKPVRELHVGPYRPVSELRALLTPHEKSF